MNVVIAAQVRDANRRFYDALEALDIDAMEAVWSQDDGVVCVHPGGPVQRGWEDVRAAWAQVYALLATTMRLGRAAVRPADRSYRN